MKIKERQLDEQVHLVSELQHNIEEAGKREAVLVEDLTQAEFERDVKISQACTPRELADLLQLTPKSKIQVNNAAKRGVSRTATRATPSPTTSGGANRNRFMENVGRCYEPILEKVCSHPKFNGGLESRPERVIKQVLKRISKKRKGQAIAHGRPGTKKKDDIQPTES